jgi:hypothetical protein
MSARFSVCQQDYAVYFLFCKDTGGFAPAGIFIWFTLAAASCASAFASAIAHGEIQPVAQARPVSSRPFHTTSCERRIRFVHQRAHHLAADVINVQLHPAGRADAVEDRRLGLNGLGETEMPDDTACSFGFVLTMGSSKRWA